MPRLSRMRHRGPRSRALRLTAGFGRLPSTALDNPSVRWGDASDASPAASLAPRFGVDVVEPEQLGDPDVQSGRDPKQRIESRNPLSRFDLLDRPHSHAEFLEVFETEALPHPESPEAGAELAVKPGELVHRASMRAPTRWTKTATEYLMA